MLKPYYILYYDAYQFLIDTGVLKPKPMGLFKSFWLKSWIYKDAVEGMANIVNDRFIEHDKFDFSDREKHNRHFKYHSIHRDLDVHSLNDYIAIMHVAERDCYNDYVKKCNYPYVFDSHVRCISTDSPLLPDQLDTLTGRCAIKHGTPMDKYEKVQKFIDVRN